MNIATFAFNTKYPLQHYGRKTYRRIASTQGDKADGHTPAGVKNYVEPQLGFQPLRPGGRIGYSG